MSARAAAGPSRALRTLLALLLALTMLPVIPGQAWAASDSQGTTAGVSVEQSASWVSDTYYTMGANLTFSVSTEPQYVDESVTQVDYLIVVSGGGWKSLAAETAKAVHDAAAQALPGSRFALVGSNPEATCYSDFTSDKKEFESALDKFEKNGDYAHNVEASALARAREMVSSRDDASRPARVVLAAPARNLGGCEKVAPSVKDAAAAGLYVVNLNSDGYSRGDIADADSTFFHSEAGSSQRAALQGLTRPLQDAKLSVELAEGFGFDSSRYSNSTVAGSVRWDASQSGRTVEVKAQCDLYSGCSDTLSVPLTPSGYDGLTADGDSAVTTGASLTWTAGGATKSLDKGGMSLYTRQQTLSYDANGGSGVDLPAAVSCWPGQSVALAQGAGLAKDGRPFTGWKVTDASGFAQYVPAGAAVTVGASSLTATATYGGASLTKGTSTEGVRNVLARNWFDKQSQIARDKVATISFSAFAPAGSTVSWDAAESGKVTAYAVPTAADGTMYDVTLVSPGEVYAPFESRSLFSGFSKCTSIDLSRLNTSNVKWVGDGGASGMFKGCTSLTSLDVSGFDTSKVTDMGSMFSSCQSLTSITGLDSLNTSSVTNMHYMFEGCTSLTSLDVSNFDTSKVTDIGGIFGSCQSLTSITGLDSLNTSSVTNMHYMFGGCTSLTSLDVSNFDTSKVTDMSDMFVYCPKLASITGLEKFDTSKVTDMSGMFNQLGSLTSLDVSNFDTSSVTDMNNMFSQCTSLTELDVSSFKTSKVTVMDGMFAICPKLASITGLEKFDTANVTDMGSWKRGMFQKCTSLTELDLSSFDTSKVTSMRGMFQECTSLTELDLSNFDTSKVTDIGGIFGSCQSLTSITGLDSLNTSSVTNMYYMFGGCTSLTSLDVSNFDTSKVTDMSDMFQGCTSLTELDVSSFDTSKVTDMSCMFQGCTSLTELDLSNFDTSIVTDMVGMLEFLNINLQVKCRTEADKSRMLASSNCSIPAANFTVVGALAASAAPASLSLTDGSVTPLAAFAASEPDGDGQPASASPQAAAGSGASSTLVDKGEVFKGDEVEYFLTVSNTSEYPDASSGTVSVADTLPKYMEYVDGSAAIDAEGSYEGASFLSQPSYDASSRTLSFQVAGIPAGYSVAVSFKAKVTDDADSLNKTIVEYVNQATMVEGGMTTVSNGVRHYSGARTGAEHSVTYQYSGDVPAAAPALPSEAGYTQGAEVALAPAPSVPGYAFGGWKVYQVSYDGGGSDNDWTDPGDEDGPAAYALPSYALCELTVADGSFTMPHGDVVVEGTWAKAQVDTLSVAYDHKGWDTYESQTESDADKPSSNLPQAPAGQAVVKGADVSIPADPTKDADGSDNGLYPGYVFKGWTCAEHEITDAEREAGSFSTADIAGGTVTFVGNWERASYEVSYAYAGDVPGGVTAPATQAVKWGESVAVPADPTAAGYTFGGWAASPALDIANGSFTMPMSDVTLTGTFEKDDTRRPLVVVGGTSEKSLYDEGETVKVKPDGKDGHAFTGWTVKGPAGNDLEIEATGPDGDGWYSFEMPDEELVTVVANYVSLAARDFSVSVDEATGFAKAWESGSDEDKAAALAEMRRLAGVDENAPYTVANSDWNGLKAKRGTYQVTFGTADSYTCTVNCTVTDKGAYGPADQDDPTAPVDPEKAAEHITANSFRMGVGEVQTLLGGDDEQARVAELVRLASASAVSTADGSSVDIADVDVKGLSAKKGGYPVTFKTAAGTSATVTCTVYDASGEAAYEKPGGQGGKYSERAFANDFKVKASVMAKILKADASTKLSNLAIQADFTAYRTDTGEEIAVATMASDPELAAKAGKYQLTFATTNGTGVTVTCTVYNPSSGGSAEPSTPAEPSQPGEPDQPDTPDQPDQPGPVDPSGPGEDDPAGSHFGYLKARSTKQGARSVTVEWTEMKDVDGYLIYGNKCGKKSYYLLVKDVAASSGTSWTQKGLEKARYHKYRVKAYKVVDGEKVVVASSVTVHATTTGGRYGVAKSVAIKSVGGKKGAKKATLAVGKTAKVKAAEVGSKPIKRHRPIAFETSDAKVAKVTKAGKIRAVGKGTCKVWVYAQNGVYKTVKVTVR